MVTVKLVNLKKGERPPPKPKPVIVDCRGTGGVEISDSHRQMVIKVRYADLQSTIAELAENGVKKIYVRGLEKDA